MTRAGDSRAPATAVPIGTLSKGDRFTPAYGGHYTYDRVDGVSEGVHHATHEDGVRKGLSTMFAGCADVVPGWHETGWLQK
jgi:hypothetical protein